MPKNIVFCADGTWQGPTGGPASNVLKLFNCLDGLLTVGASSDPEQERADADADGTVQQVAKYIDGVGFSNNWLARLAGGSVGLGLVARVLRGYTFISRNYAPGDQIFLTGFSRGAYTARTLAGFICTQGLLDWNALELTPANSDDRGYQYAAAAWYHYQQTRMNAASSPTWVSRMQGILSVAPEFGSALLLSPAYQNDIPIRAVGVWDTVGALGIPELSDDAGARLDILRFADTALHRNIEFGFHAVAADEQRIDFSPTLWDVDDRVTQCFFPGSHADVGGGFPLGDESRLSDLALAWMVGNLAKQGLRTTAPIVAAQSELGPEHMPWTELPYSARPTGPREFPAYLGENAPVGISPGLRNRLGQTVQLVALTIPPVSRAVCYVPTALAHAGYVDLSQTTMKP